MSNFPSITFDMTLTFSQGFNLYIQGHTASRIAPVSDISADDLSAVFHCIFESFNPCLIPVSAAL